MRLLASLLVALAVGHASGAEAKPVAPAIFCTAYPEVCSSGLAPDCTYCHTAPPLHNAFGAALEKHFPLSEPRPLEDRQFEIELLDALRAVEPEDSDGDGSSNLQEILAGTWPGDAKSAPAAKQNAACPESSDKNGGYDTCRYDPRFVFKKLHLDFCGALPDQAAVRAFESASDQYAELDRALDACLLTDFWRGREGVVWHFASPKITPLGIVKSGEDSGLFPIVDYFDDYNLYVYSQTDNHDAREVLTAQFIVRYEAGPPARYVRVDRTTAEDMEERDETQAQLVDTEQRAGILTTRWTLFYHTMFSTMPRTTAAQIYRSYLGLDIAKLEGLYPVANEPADYDTRGVGASGCAHCHSTLDPLSYPFSRYEGILLALTGTASPDTAGFISLYGAGNSMTYMPDRLDQIAAIGHEADSVKAVPEAGAIFGTEVRDLREWAQVAANSSAFARATVLEYWQYLLGEPPDERQLGEFDRLWKKFPEEHAYGVDRMLHDLIRTEAYGVP